MCPLLLNFPIIGRRLRVNMLVKSSEFSLPVRLEDLHSEW